MSQVNAVSSASSTPTSNFQSILNAALEGYEKRTKERLLTHPLAAQLQLCNSPAEVLSVLEALLQQFDQRRRSDERLRNWLIPTVNVLYTFSATLGKGARLVFSPASVMFTGIGVLLLAAKDAEASQGALVDLSGRIENFFRRIESYTDVPPTAAMLDIIIKIMIEVLSMLAVATKEIKQGRAKKYIQKLMGKNDIDNALKRLDTLTQEEVRIATAEVLKVMRGTDQNVKAILNDRKEIKTGIQQTESKVDDVKRKQLRRELRNWLSPPDPSTNHNIARNAQHEGTSTWFFEGRIYKEWMANPSLLWIHGKRKSVLCSAIIQDVMALRESESALMAYFYCDFRDEDKQYRRNMILSFLFQLSAQSNTCFDALWDLYSAHDDGAQKPSDGALLQCLKEVLSLRAQGRMYLILDALDECPQNSGMPSSREQALDLVKSLIKLSSPNLHICVTSRPEIDIRNALEPMTSFRVSLHEQSGQKKDIIEYVNSVVYSDIMMQRWREDDKRLVVETLSERADGM
ncbi:hypothetical protein BC827DRAFT_22708 [Russula dissimulans]|nr:hypothetical protein BC827DRAFT_22708 [Russula dissimulans]